METLTLADVRVLARDAVQERGPDYRYSDGTQSCFYVPVATIMAWLNNGDLSPTSSHLYDVIDIEEIPGAGDDDESTLSFTEVTGLRTQPRYSSPCMVGWILDRAGETRHRDLDGMALGAEQLCEKFPGMMTEEAAEYLAVLQEHQDTGKTWQLAWNIAEENLSENAPVLEPADE